MVAFLDAGVDESYVHILCQNHKSKSRPICGSKIFQKKLLKKSCEPFLSILYIMGDVLAKGKIYKGSMLSKNFIFIFFISCFSVVDVVIVKISLPISI